MKTPILTLLFSLLIPVVLRADPVTLTRAQAWELHETLTALADGLTPDNTMTAADDINALEPVARSYRAGYAALERVRLSADTPEKAVAYAKAAEDFDRKGDEPMTFELTLLILDKREIAAAKVTSRQLAAINRLLKPKVKTPATP